MASPTTYPLLVTAITDMAEDDSAEFLAFIPTAINMAEDRLFRELDINFSKEADPVLTCTPSNPVVTKPTDLRITTSISVVVSGERIPLVKRADDFLSDYWPNDSVTDIPKYYADRDILTWRLAPTPSSNYQLQVMYDYKPEYLTPVNTTNIFVDRYPDMMFYATMVNICEYMKDTERKQEWDARFQDAVRTVNEEGIRTTKEDNPDKVNR